MAEKFKVIIEYTIKSDSVHQYEKEMRTMLSLLPKYGFSNIEWFSYGDEHHHYVEMYEVPSESHIYALKKLRNGLHTNSMFSSLKIFLNGTINYWVFKKIS